MKRLTTLLFLIFLFFSKNSYAFLNFNIKNNKEEKTKIVFADFNYISYKESSKKERENAYNILKKTFNTIEKDLLTTNFFEIENNFFIKENKENGIISNLKNYEKDKTIILKGIIKFTENKNFELEIELFNSLSKEKVWNKNYIVDNENYIKNAHVLSEDIHQTLTGEEVGHFNSKILYIAKDGKKNKVAMVDFDGSSLQYLTGTKNLVLTPIFSRKNKDEIFYLEYIKDLPKIRKVNFEEETIETIGNFEEMSFSPSFHPAGENVLLLSAFKNNIANIYKYDLDKDELIKLTFNKSIDIASSFSPDGEWIVFCSNRSGVQKLYMMDKNGKNVEKITHGRGNYSKPAWSPDGKLIAFTKFYKDKFSIGTIKTNGQDEKSLVSGYLVEGVRWSPNGKYLMYSKQDKVISKPYIYITDILNKYEYRLPTPLGEGAIDPDWVNN